MAKFITIVVTVLLLGALIIPRTEAEEEASGAAVTGEEIGKKLIAMEEAALERWGNADVDGFLEIIAADYTYFSPGLDKRLDGYEAIEKRYQPVRGKIHFDRFELIDPKVQIDGNMAVLTFNFKSYTKQEDGSEKQGVHWHTTEVFRNIDGNWKLISTHWSFTSSQLRKMAESGELSQAADEEP